MPPIFDLGAIKKPTGSTFFCNSQYLHTRMKLHRQHLAYCFKNTYDTNRQYDMYKNVKRTLDICKNSTLHTSLILAYFLRAAVHG